MEQQQNNPIPKDQLDLPVGYDFLDRPIPLRNYKKELENQLTRFRTKEKEFEDDRRKLALERLRKVKNYGEFRVAGYGIINRERALLEIENSSDLGDYLITVEMNTIKVMIEKIEK